ncbi:MAG: hypothetical protein ACRDZ9_05365 [Acidimicrobiales bacterium]
MSQITVTATSPGSFGVEITEGHQVTGHRVTVPEPFLEELGLGDADGEQVVRESMAFLLEREPATSIMEEFPLTTIARYFPEYPEELRRRLS